MSFATNAYQRLLTAMDTTTPACTGIDLFTADDLDKADREVLKGICTDCSLAAMCAEYARAAKPTGGFWAGITIQKREAK